jgi:hypothetical protein
MERRVRSGGDSQRGSSSDARANVAIINFAIGCCALTMVIVLAVAILALR